MRIAIGILCLALLGPAAFTARAEPPAADARATYRAALKEGRELAQKGNHVAAVAAFMRALVALPDDPAALSELGLAAREARDLTQAEQATRKGFPDADAQGVGGLPAAGGSARRCVIAASSSARRGAIDPTTAWRTTRCESRSRVTG